MPSCECGCGSAATGAFLPGHDQKLRTDLERRAGGLLALRELVVAAEDHLRGSLSAVAFGDRARTLLAAGQR